MNSSDKLTAVNYEDYSSGRVIYGGSGATNFPIRLSNQIFEACVNYLKDGGDNGPYKVYDPFCGFAYTLTTLGFMYPNNIKALYGSDIAERSLEFASKNLSLLSVEGMSKRVTEISELAKQYGKDSHKEALVSAERLTQQLAGVAVEVASFKHDAVADTKFPSYISDINIVIVDLPYGQLTEWSDASGDGNSSQTFLNNLASVLSESSIVAITSDKKQDVEHEGYERIKKFNTGKRKTMLLRKVHSA